MEVSKTQMGLVNCCLWNVGTFNAHFPPHSTKCQNIMSNEAFLVEVITKGKRWNFTIPESPSGRVVTPVYFLSSVSHPGPEGYPTFLVTTGPR
ncbi:hypothetical protein SLE2022_302920 [Rubroshorea leprosula]